MVYRHRKYDTREEAQEVALRLCHDFDLRAGVRRFEGGFHVVVDGVGSIIYGINAVATAESDAVRRAEAAGV